MGNAEYHGRVTAMSSAEAFILLGRDYSRSFIGIHGEGYAGPM